MSYTFQSGVYFNYSNTSLILAREMCLDTLTQRHQCFHGSSGDNYAEMSRTGLQPVDTGNAGNLYLMTFSCRLLDTSAAKQWDQARPNDLSIERFNL